MKKLLLIIFSLIAVGSAALATERSALETSSEALGVVSGWKFSPLQIGSGFPGYRFLMDEDTHTVLALSPGGLTQNSAVFSLSTGSSLGSNYLLQIATVFADTDNSFGVQYSSGIALSENNYGVLLSCGAYARNNYGLACALITYSWDSYGVLAGVLSGTGIDGNHGVRIGLYSFEKLFAVCQICGIDIAGLLYIGVVNYKAPVQVGAVNFSDGKNYFQLGLFNHGESSFQLGLLNYNPRSYIPWLPLINFDMKSQ